MLLGLEQKQNQKEERKGTSDTPSKKAQCSIEQEGVSTTINA